MKRGTIRFLISVFLFLFVAIRLSAQVSSDSTLGIAGEFNVYVIDNAEFKSSDAEGRIAVGGSAVFNRFDVGTNIPNPPAGLNVLIAGKNLTFNGFCNVRNGNAVYGDTLKSADSLGIPEGTVSQGYPLDFSAVSLKVASLSRQWKLLPANATSSLNGSTLTLSGSDPLLNIFEVDGSSLSSITSIQVDAPAGATVLINVSGDTLSLSGGNSVSGTHRSKVIYNFFEADSLTISGTEFLGSILAPFASVNFISGVVYGNFIVYSYNGPGQFNLSPFSGKIKFEKSEISSDCEVTIKRILTGTIFRVSPKWFHHSRLWAGTFLGYVNGNSAQFYCIDINHWLQFRAPYTFDKTISGPIKYIIDNYYPNVPYTGTNGQLNRNYLEAASVQAAIWSYSDGVNLNNITNSTIRNRAIQIAADAKNKAPSPVETFKVLPVSQMVYNNAAATFKIIMKDQNGDPKPNAKVSLSTTAGNLTPTQGQTDANGELVFTVAPDGDHNSAVITVVTFDAVIPVGSRYYRPNKQTLITNTPVVTCLTTTAKVYWSDNPTPGNSLKFMNFNTQNAGIPENWITALHVYKKTAYVGFKSSGVGIMNTETEEWEYYNTSNGKLPSDAVSALRIVELSGYKGDMLIGTETQGLIYLDVSENKMYTFDPTNSELSGSSIKDIIVHTYKSIPYAVIAHNAGVSFMNLTDRSFENIDLHSADFPGGAATKLLKDQNNEIWVGTNYGLARTKNHGADWTYYTADSSDLPGNNITALAAGDGKIFVGTSHNGLAAYDKNSDSWEDLTLNISSQPVTALTYADNKLFIGNYDHGLYIYDGENFAQYASVRPNHAPDVINNLFFDAKDIWIATQSGLSRTINGLKPSTGNAKVLLTDAETYVGGTAVIPVVLEPTSDISFASLTGTLAFNSNEVKIIDYIPAKLMNKMRFKILEKTDNTCTFKIFGKRQIKKGGTLFNISLKVKDTNPDAGITALYLTDFYAGVDNELDHSDLGIVYFSLSGSGNAGKGDANLDDKIDLSDLLTVVHHINYGGDYELTGDGLTNADVNGDGKVNASDVSDYMFYLQNGLFPQSEPPVKNAGKIKSKGLKIETSGRSVVIPLRVESKEKASTDIRDVQVSLSYDPSLLSFESFESDLLETGNFVNAVEKYPGNAVFTFASPINRDNNFDLTDIILNYSSDNIPEGAQITTTYTVNGGDEQTGPTITISPTGVKETLPTNYSLFQNYPNPFNPTTTIRFSIPKESAVKLVIYDILGREVRTLVNTEVKPGTFNYTWDGKNNSGANAASGLYFYRLNAGKYTKTMKMILIK